MILRNVSEGYASDYTVSFKLWKEVSSYDSLIEKKQPDIQYEAHMTPLITIECCLACTICEF